MISKEGIIRLISNTLDYAINENKMEDIEYMLSGKPFPGIPQDELEFDIFSMSYFLFTNNVHKNDRALKYLIFDYNIDEQNFVKLLAMRNIEIDQRVKDMFEVRKNKAELVSELNQNLKTNNKEISKKLKV